MPSTTTTAAATEPPDDLQAAAAEAAFDQFFTAVTCRSILQSFQQLLDVTGLRHADHRTLYGSLREQLKQSWKARSLWAKLDKRASHRDYGRGRACKDTRVLIIGSGPCGLRTAIECAFLGARTVIVEKRDRFSRNNVLHLWPYLITDLKNLGAKMFFGKFCAGAIDHISIRQLQCILLKVALLVGVEVHVNVSFDGLIEPTESNSWKCKCTPEDHPLSEYQFDALIGADGKRNTLSGFRRKEFRGKLAIAITANFINRNTNAEARVEEISGVAFIFNQKFFLELKEKTGIDLENIVYYKDDTHYFVMTAKKQSLLEKGVLLQDLADTVALLDRSNVNQDALMNFATEAADFSTNHQLPALDYAVNHYGQADVAMFDFTSMFAAENASRVLEKNGQRLLMGLVGDSLLEPFWPTGSGCARGFLGAFDAAWMIRSWASGRMTPLEVIAERESIYTVLSQTTPDRLHKNFHHYSLDPNTRYPNLNTSRVKPRQVVGLFDGVVDPKELEEAVSEIPVKRARNVPASEYNVDSYSLLRWCQRVLNTGMYRNVHVIDFTSSWRTGLAFCALIHAFRPHLLNNNSLMECEVVKNNQLAFDIAEKELGIAPVMTGADMVACPIPDKLTMVAYLSQFYELFKHEPLPSSVALRPKIQLKEEKVKTLRSPKHRASLLGKLSARLNRSKKRKEKEEGEGIHLSSKKPRDLVPDRTPVELTKYNKLPMEEIANRLQLDRQPPTTTNVKREKPPTDTGSVSVTAMAEVLVAKFKCNEDQPAPPPVRRLKGQPVLLAAQSVSEFCYFCKKRVYIMERQGAEGVFFHRHCFRCDYCGVGLHLNNYSCEREQGQAKFYCYRHFAAELRTKPNRKRNLEVANVGDETKENIPDTVVTPPEEENVLPQVETAFVTPKKIIPAPLAVPGEVFEKAKNTPERIEFEISFDGAEETEEEQWDHNLRESMSSDAILLDNDDDDDSDMEGEDILGYVSESEVARILDEWSGTEDDIFETAQESLNAATGKDLTWEEVMQLSSSWKRQHSLENLASEGGDEGNGKRRHPSKDAYERLYSEQRDEEEEWDDEDGSSTEVEGDNEYYTDDSSADEATEEESEHTHGGGSTADTLEGGGTGEDSVSAATATTSPSSPAVRAARASFFSAPPTVVRLDPWRMFNKDKKEEETASAKAETEQEAAGDSPAAAASKRVTEPAQPEEEVRSLKDEIASIQDNSVDEDNRDTDISESLEMDSVRADSDRRLASSKEGSAEDLTEEENQGEFSAGEAELEGASEVQEQKEEELDRTAVSQAMQQLLQDIDETSNNTVDFDGLLRSFSGENDNIDKEFEASQEHLQNTESLGVADGVGGGTLESVLRSVRDMEDTTTTASGEDTLRQVLEDVAAMPDLSESELNIGQFTNLDERFVTDRKKPCKKWQHASKEAEGMAPLGSESDLTISTPSESLSSSSSSSSLGEMVEYNQRFLATGTAEDDLKPDEDMMNDYMTTLSMALGDSDTSDTELKLDKRAGPTVPSHRASSPRDDDINKTLEGEKSDILDDTMVTTMNSSVYLTPELSMEETPLSEHDFKLSLKNAKPQRSMKSGPVVNKAVVSEKVTVAPKSSSKESSKVSKSVAGRGPRKLPDVPKLKIPPVKSTLNNSTAPVTSKKPTSVSTISSKSVSKSNNKPSSSSSGSELSKPPSRASGSSRQPSTSSAPSSDSSRSSAPRALPRPGVAKRVSSASTTTSSDHSSCSPVRAGRTASTTAQAQSVPDATEGVSGVGKKVADSRTVIKVDQGSLWSDSSTDQQTSDSEIILKKRIPVDASAKSLPLPEAPSHKPSVISDIEDIPFADESEADDKFFTPSVSLKQKAITVQPEAQKAVRKRLLPGVPLTEPGVPSVEQIQRMKQADDAKARQVSQNYPQHKADEGADRGRTGPSAAAAFVNPSYSNGAARPNDRRSSSYDSDHILHNPTGNGTTPSADSSATETTDSKGAGRGKKREKSMTASAAKVKMRKSKEFVNKRKKEEKEASEEATKKEKNRRSLLDMLRPAKAAGRREKGGAPGSGPASDSDQAPPGRLKKSSKVSPGTVPEEKAKKSKSKHKRNQSRDSVDEATGLAAGIKDLSVAGPRVHPVFACDTHALAAERDRRQLARPVPLAPKASADEFSDSDESQVSVNTLLRRKDPLTDMLDERVARKLKRVMARQQKQAEQQRLCAAQEIQRLLQEVDERQRELEDRGIAVEKALRGEGPEADVDENQLMGEWFNLVHEKNALVRYESELMVRAKELELEDRQSRLQASFRECSLKPEEEKTEEEVEAEGHLLDELLDVVEQRNALVAMLEEDRLREQEEDRELEDMMVKKGFMLSPLTYIRPLTTPSPKPLNATGDPT